HEGGHTVFFRNTQRGKKSFCVNLKTDAGREAVLRLAETADVFVEAFRPGVVDRLGVGYAAVSARNPRIVYCSISAFGQDGPYRDRPAHDLSTEALSGIVSLNQGNDGE
ncbi:MAG: CoA transferase, partial [bacterium]